MPFVGASREHRWVRPHRSSASHPPLRRARPRARRRSGPSLVIRGLVLVGLLLVLIAVTAVGATGFVAMSSIATLSQDLPDPSALSTLSFDQPTIVYDRTGKVRARPLPARARRVVDYRRRPAARPRRDDDRRGPDVLGQRRLRRRGDRRRRGRDASRATGAAPRRSPSSSSGPGCCRPTSSTPAPTCTCARPRSSSSRARLTEAFPGADRQAADHHRLPQRDLLRPRRVRHRRGGPDLLRRHDLSEADAGPGRPARRPAQVALDASTRTATPCTNKKGQLVVPPDAPPVVRRDWILENLVDVALDAPHAAAARGGHAEPVDPAGDQPLIYRAPHFMWQVRRQLEQILGVGRRGRDRRLPGHHDARLARPAARRALARRRRPSRPTCRGTGDAPARTSSRSRSADRGWINAPARQGPPQRRARRARLPDRRRARLRRQRRLLPRRPRQPAVRAQVRRGGRRRPPAGLGVQADPLRDRVRAQGPDARHRCSSTSRPSSTRASWAPTRRRPARARAGPRPQGAPDVAQHPGHPGAPARRQRRRSRTRRRGSGSASPGGKRGLPAGRARRRDRHGRGPAARPDVAPTARSPTAASTCRRG